MDLCAMKGRSTLMLLLLLLLPMLITAKIINKGYLTAGKEVEISFDSVNPDDCLEYNFMTNYKKVYYSLTTTPSTNVNFKQRIILTDMPFSKCPQRCTEEPNYCTAISNKIFSQTQATFSKCFPTLYIYIINQPATTTNLVGFLDSVSDLESIGDSNLEISSTLNNLVDANTNLQDVTEKSPIFTLTPTHLTNGCKILDDLVPQCASLSSDDCINPAFCTTKCGLLTCQSGSGENLFSLCTANNYTQGQLQNICSAHANYGDQYKWSKCENPIPYNPSLSETAVSILLVCCVMMTLLVV